jgi:VWFA-related protein
MLTMLQRGLRRFIGIALQRRTAVILLCLALLPGALAAQPSPLSETLDVRLIEFDAIVTDRKGNPVPGLGPDDFELFENGRRQEITNFSEYRDGEDVTLEAAEAFEPAVPSQRRTIVVLVDAFRLGSAERRKLFADLHAIVERTMREGDRGQVLTWHDRQGLGVLTEMTFSRAEIIGALTTAEATLHADPADTSFEDQGRWFREMAAEPDPRGGPGFDGESNARWAARQAGDQALAVMRRKTAAIQRILPAMAEPSYRNVMIYVSGSFPMIAGRNVSSDLRTRTRALEEEDHSTIPMIEAITRTANAHGIIVYALRPEVTSPTARTRSSINIMESGLSDPFAGGGSDSAERVFGPNVDSGDRTFGVIQQQAPHMPMGSGDLATLQNDVQALSILTRETGGTVAIGPAGIAEAIDSIARDLDSYYTLAYRAASDGSDRERRIDLRPKSRHHVVRMRRTILDRSDATRVRDLMVARLFEQGSGGDIEFDIETGRGKPAGASRILIPIELTIPVEQLQFENEGEELAARFSVLLVAGENIGQITRLQEASRRIVVEQGSEPVGIVRYEFELMATPRPTNVSIAVFDEKSGLAGVQSIVVEGDQVTGEAVSSASEADTIWHEAMLRASEERKPIVVYFRPSRCSACTRFERDALQHPVIQRRLSDVVFLQVSPTAGEIAKVWSSREAGIGMFDRLGTFRMHFPGVPDSATFGVILNDVIDVAPHLERALTAVDRGEPADGELDVGIAYIMLGRRSDARTALERAISEGKPETRQYGRIASALLDALDGRPADALEQLDRIISDALTPHVAGEAWLTVGIIHLRAGAADEAARALSNARDLLGSESRIAATSDYARAALESAPGGANRIRLIPPDDQLVRGRVTLKTSVAAVEVAAVTFELDGVVVERVARPPFSTTIDFGEVPEQRTIGVVAFDGRGVEIGRDELTVNEGGERFWLRLIEPREGEAGGPTRVRMALRSPSTEAVERITISWNDAVRTVVTAPPWEANVQIPEGEIGVLRGVAQLADGRSAEDAVLLNAPGHVEWADVPLVELPVTVSGRMEAALVRNQIAVREGGRHLTIDSIQDAAEVPLTVGLVIDTSGSMQQNLLDVQAAAIAFLDSVLDDGDRAFLIEFSTRARLVQPATSDRELLRQSIIGLRARGSTSLYDAIAVGLLQLEGVKGRRGLVVFTDGVDRTSVYGVRDVGELARRTHVPIHLIAATPDPRFESFPARGSRGLDPGLIFHTLSRMAESTGGSAHRLRSVDELPQVYGQIQSALHSQFLLFIRTEPGKNGSEWRNIKVDLAARDVTVHAPEGYYAPW